MTDKLPGQLRGKRIYMVGIKGTGMAAFAELLLAHGAIVTGSDTPDVFFTDEILKALGIPYREGFSADNLSLPIDLVIHSAAYSPDTHPELLKAREWGLPVEVYTQALGEFSGHFFSAGVSGVHGKTTTTAMAGVLCRALGLPFSILAGSAVPDFGERSTLSLGERFFIAETCEYKRHFLSFHPQALLVTSIELDHTDYFKDEADIFKAFVEYAEKLPTGAPLIYCADQAGSAALAETMRVRRPDLTLIGYGENAHGAFRIVRNQVFPGRQSFHLEGFFPDFSISIPGHHNVLNAAGALALSITLYEKQHPFLGSTELQRASEQLAAFRGSRRRSQIVGEADGVLVMDDYGHHPTAIETTLRGLKAFYPDRRLVVDFMSHTYSRTKTLLTEFASCFSSADEVILHKIYASAREADDPEISGEILFRETQKHHLRVRYFENVQDAVPYYLETLTGGDLLVTMGAGDNWKAGMAFLKAKSGEAR